MLLEISNIKVTLDEMQGFNQGDMDPLREAIARALNVAPCKIGVFELQRRSIDARRKADVHFAVSVKADVAAEDGAKPHEGIVDNADALQELFPNIARGVRVARPKPLDMPIIEDVSAQSAALKKPRPVIVGAGPAGLFCALYLARAGLRPIIVERGKAVDERKESIEDFKRTGRLDPNSNIQFGEGGAGTFSDGKLATGIKSPYIRFVLETFAAAGAPKDILIDAKPHIGTDYLVKVVENLRQTIEEAGGEFRFNTQFIDIVTQESEDGAGQAQQKLASAIMLDLAGQKTFPIDTDTLVLAMGHSARDSVRMLLGRGFAMKKKPFAVGLRIEHLQSFIDKIQYGKYANHPALPPADYKMAVKTREGRGVYTFCMCPGGEVVAAASDEGAVCVNGMSNHARDGRNANSAILVEVRPDDLEEPVLSGIEFQEQLEKRAFDAAEEEARTQALKAKAYAAPMQTLGSFMGTDAERGTRHFARGATPKPTYPLGTVSADLHKVFPPFIDKALVQAFPLFDAKMHGFADEGALLTAVEARSSSPVCIVRDKKTLESVNVAGVYPCGEGAGYAGGITSSAVDGIKVAKKVVDCLIRDFAIDRGAQALMSQKPLIFPTDTVYGLGISVKHNANADVLYGLKRRPKDKPISWLIGSFDDLFLYGTDVPDYAVELARKHWPGNMTLIVKASDEVPESYRSCAGTVALRLPASETALRLIALVGSPLATTSANISSEMDAVSSKAIDARLKDEAYVIEADDEVVTAVPSCIIDCTHAEPIHIR